MCERENDKINMENMYKLESLGKAYVYILCSNFQNQKLCFKNFT